MAQRKASRTVVCAALSAAVAVCAGKSYHPTAEHMAPWALRSEAVVFVGQTCLSFLRTPLLTASLCLKEAVHAPAAVGFELL